MTLSVALYHEFPGFTLDVAFDAPPGVTALFGRSGSGKTTVVNALAGLLKPDQGRVTLDGTTLLDTKSGRFLPPNKRRIGYVFQDARLFPHMTVQQNLLYGRWFAPKSRRRADFDQVIQMLGIEHLLTRRPGRLSGGEKSRVALGRALLSDPALLLMDEPLAALDDARKAEILPYLERLRDTVSLPILYVSHSAAEVARLATTVVLVSKGRVSAAGPAAAVLSDPNAAQGFGPREAGAIIEARVEAAEDDGLTRLSTAGGPVWLQGVPSTTKALRLRVLAQDVTLATERPQNISALNVLQGRVLDLADSPDGVLIRIAMGEDHLLARITPRSVKALALEPGRSVFAILKTVAMASDAVSTKAG